MKTRLILFVQGLILILLMSQDLHAQKQAIWKGGTPGRTSDWNCAKNWSNNEIPDEFTDVVVKNTAFTSGFVPVIVHKNARVNSLTIHSGASVEIVETGKLVIENGLERFGNARLENKGLILRNEFLHAQTNVKPKALVSD